MLNEELGDAGSTKGGDSGSTYGLVTVCIWFINKAGIFEAGFGEILHSSLLQWAEKQKFQTDSHKPGVTDPGLIYQ